MDINLKYLPERSKKSRLNGITIISDQDLSLEGLNNLVSRYSQYIDLIKLPANLYLCKETGEKIQVLTKSEIHPFFSGTLFEIFYVRKMLDQYIGYLKDTGLTHIEVSDSIIEISPTEKLSVISRLAKEFTVISKVGYRYRNVILTTESWKKQITSEINAGAWKVIIEGGANSDSGIYDKNNEPKQGLIFSLLSVENNRLIWETNYTEQQAWFINKQGANVNLSNINSSEILNLESMRLGLHPLTFYKYLPEAVQVDFERKVSPLANIDFQI